MEGVSPSVVLVPAQSKSRRLAAKACWAAWVRMADQRERREASTALRRMLGTALAFVWAKRRRKVVASGLHRPLFRWRGPRACTFWNGEVLGMCAPWICVRCSGVLAGTSSGLAGGSQRRYQGGVDRELRTPAWAHAARWSPNGSKMRRHRQMRADRGSGRRRRRRSRTRKR